jgi:serine/threonine protein kinase
VAAKDIDMSSSRHWDSPTYWAEADFSRKNQRPINHYLKEVEMHVRLCTKRRSPFILPLRGCRIDKDLRFVRIATAFAAHGDLHSLVEYFYSSRYERKLGPLTHFLYSIFNGLVEGCNKMEERDVVHRDLKAANVLLGIEKDNEMFGWKVKPMICDFGQAVEGTPEHLKNPEDYTGCGTSGYIAPVSFPKETLLDQHVF